MPRRANSLRGAPAWALALGQSKTNPHGRSHRSPQTRGGASDNRLLWKVVVDIDIEGWPDWSWDEPITVLPA